MHNLPDQSSIASYTPATVHSIHTPATVHSVHTPAIVHNIQQSIIQVTKSSLVAVPEGLPLLAVNFMSKIIVTPSLIPVAHLYCLQSNFNERNSKATLK